MISSRRLKYLFGGVLLSAIVVWIVSAGPMLVHIRFGPLQHDPRFAIWNPLRSRAPERRAVEYLRKIQSTACSQEVATLEISNEQKIAACEKQVRHPVTASCPLIDRRDSGTVVWLLFQCPQEAHSDVTADISLTLTAREANWVLVGYDRIY